MFRLIKAVYNSMYYCNATKYPALNILQCSNCMLFRSPTGANFMEVVVYTIEKNYLKVHTFILCSNVAYLNTLCFFFIIWYFQIETYNPTTIFFVPVDTDFEWVQYCSVLCSYGLKSVASSLAYISQINYWWYGWNSTIICWKWISHSNSFQNQFQIIIFCYIFIAI